MPVHQISVVPAKETATNGRSSGKNKDKNKEENDKAPGRSGSRSSNISKASSSTTGIGPTSISRTSVTPSAQDICSCGALPALQEEVALPTGAGQIGKRQVKRRRRRRQGPDEGHVYAHRLQSRSSSSEEQEEEAGNWRKERSWSQERARRRRRRSLSNRDKGGQREVQHKCNEADSWRGDTCAHLGLKNRGKPLVKREESIGLSPPSPAEENHITKQYVEPGEGVEELAQSANGRPTCTDEELEVCRICHCEGDDECPLITPCRCTGSLRFVHPDCLHQWIKSSDTRCCELCKYDFIMETQLKPLRKWEKLQMSTRERRQIFCSVTFHVIAVVCVVWSLYVLIDRTAEEIKQGRENGVLEWPFWTKLIVVAIGFTGGLIFMYIQCKVYLQLWRRLKAYNRIIFVQNCPDAGKKAESANHANGGRYDLVEVVLPPPASYTDTNSHKPAGGAAILDMAPV